MKTIQQWKDIQFESSSALTPQFASFARAYKKAIIETLGNKFALVSWNRGHFYISTFFRNTLTGKLVYLSCSDVRFFPQAWYDNILIRTAEHERDFTGGTNHYASLGTLYETALGLTAELEKQPRQLVLL
jgi:hypothetical protein